MGVKRGMVGWSMVLASFFMWVMIVTVWYDSAPALDLVSNRNLTIAIWWTVVCGACVFVGLKMEKVKAIE